MLVVSLSLAAVMRDLSRSVWVYKLSWVYKLCLGSQTYRVQRFSRKIGGGYYAAHIYICIYTYTHTHSIYIYIYVYIHTHITLAQALMQGCKTTLGPRSIGRT